jgi:serine/threonine-protein kinase
VTPLLLLSGRYRVLNRIGHGGMSEVWEATDEVLDRPVAIKVLGAAASTDDRVDPAGVIRAEAQAAARLAHPNVASVYDFGVAEDESGQQLAYIVMELLSGQSLGERLARGSLAARSALRIMAEVAAALAAAHSIGVVHRDVKPGNIMLTPYGAKVFDFGIAASAGDTDHADARGRILGTPSYVAPERLAGARVTPAADMYAFGVLLTRLFDEPEGVPLEIDRLRRRCLAADPSSRPTAAEAHSLVRAVLASYPSGVMVHSGRTVPLPVPAAAGLPSTDFLPQTRTPLRRWSLVATAVLLAVGGLSCLAIAVERGTRASTEVTSQNPPVPASPQAAPAPSTPAPQNAADDSGEDRFAAAISSACETEARRRNEELAKLSASGHKIGLSASVVCHNGIPTLRITR